MSQVIGQILLWLAVAAEVAIFSYVIAMSVKYCVPWDELRAKRAIRERLRVRIPELREIVRRLSAKARHPVRHYRAAWARKLGDDMTRDVLRLLGLTGVSIDAIKRHLGSWPREAAQIEDNVSGTLECIGKLLALRDVSLPETVRMRAEVAREVLAGLSVFRNEIAARIEELAHEGYRIAYERRCIALLANAFVAHASHVEEDPGRIFTLIPKWRERVTDIVVSVELRVAVEDRIAEIGVEVPERVAQLRQLLVQAQPLISRMRTDLRLDRLIARLAALTTAESVIESAENHLRTARVICLEEGTDLGAAGRSACRVKEALLMAERARQSLAIIEEDLLIATTAMDIAGGTDAKRSN